jgi:hypothetical protein
MKQPKRKQTNSNTECQRIIEITTKKEKEERFNENDWNNKNIKLKLQRMIERPNERKRQKER